MAKQKSRAERFDEAKEAILSGKGEVEMLREELESWMDNMPENLQSGSKYEQLEAGISQLDEVIDALDTIEGIEVEFPGMY